MSGDLSSCGVAAFIRLSQLRRVPVSVGSLPASAKRSTAHRDTRMTALVTYAHRVHVGPQIPAPLVFSTAMQTSVEPDSFCERPFVNHGLSTTQQNLLYPIPSPWCTPRTERTRGTRTVCDVQQPSLLGSSFYFFRHTNAAYEQRRRQSSRWHWFAPSNTRTPTAWTCTMHPAAL